MNDQAHHFFAVVGSIFTLINWNWVLLVLGAIYWLVMIWATVRRDKREADKAEREDMHPGRYPRK